MRLVFHIAWRYLFAKKSHNVINIISIISAIGIAIGCMALVVILSVYNGFDNLIKSLYNSYQPEYVIEPRVGKTFLLPDGISNQIESLDSSLTATPFVQENIFCTYNGAQCAAALCGVDSLFISKSRLAEYLVDGAFNTGIGEITGAIVSSKLAIELGIRARFTTPLMLYYPKFERDSAKLAEEQMLREMLPGYSSGITGLAGGGVMAEDPMGLLSTLKAHPSGTVQLEKSYDNGLIYISLDKARELLQYAPQEVSALYIYSSAAGSRAQYRRLSEKIKELSADKLVVKDRFMQNSTMYKMMKSEKAAVYLILLFVVAIVSFNIFGSLSMLIIDKREDIKILESMGAEGKTIRRVFVLQGTLISALGAAAGTLGGLLLSLLQYHFHLLSLPGNFIIDYYPVEIMPQDILLTLAGVIAAGYLISLLPRSR